MSQEQMQNELNYCLALRVIKKMLKKGLITDGEFKKIDQLNRNSFKPVLAEIMS